MDNEILKKYLSTIKDFIDKKITAVEFESRFLEIHSTDEGNYSYDVHRIISILFSDVDEYCSDPEIRNDNDLNEDQLLARATTAWQNLLQVLYN